MTDDTSSPVPPYMGGQVKERTAADIERVIGQLIAALPEPYWAERLAASPTNERRFDEIRSYAQACVAKHSTPERRDALRNRLVLALLLELQR